MKSDMIFVEVSTKRVGTSDWKKEFIRIDRSDIDKKHQELSEASPYCYINFHWDKGESFIWGAPHQMMLDESLPLDEYMAKWYGI
jgi:hypothetical protein